MTHPKITRPHGHDDSVFVVSASGGKDSTATILAMREAGIECRYVFADTQWEAPQTYEYLDTLRQVLGITIDVVGAEGGMRAKMDKRAGFPSRMQRWCTRELKINPLRVYHDAIEEAESCETVCVVGIRAEESDARAAMRQFEYEEKSSRSWGGYVWRPLLHWTIADVLAIHHRHGLPVNPLYRLGFDRVGCMPCIYSRKEEVRLMAEHFPERVREIEELESAYVHLRLSRNEKTPGRYAHTENASFFRWKNDPTEPSDIRSVVEWSKTSRGGKQLQLFAPVESGGCFRWGLCDSPTKMESER